MDGGGDDGEDDGDGEDEHAGSGSGDGDGARALPPGRPRGEPLTIDFEGQAVRAFAGESVAVALHASGVRTLGRSSKYHRPRGLFCLEGHCASCYLRIDGRPNLRACMTEAAPGLRCERQNAFPSADVDLLTAADWLFPGGMDHHTLMTGTRLGNRLFLKLVRQMGGSGTLPDAGAAPAATPPPEDVRADVCVVGGGPAGLTAAALLAAAPARPRVLVVDEQAVPGGSLLAEAGGAARAAALASEAAAAGARLVARATALSFYPEDAGADGQPGLLAVAAADRLLRVSARAYLYATGAYDQNLTFADNDRPGIISARACGRLAFLHGVRPGRRVIVVAGAPYALRVAAALVEAGVATEVVDLARERPVGARGVQAVRGLDLAPAGAADGEARGTRTVRGDVVAVGALPAPASELPRQHGAAVVLDPALGGFAVRVDERARCAPGAFACGDVVGYRGPDAAQDSGRAAARSILSVLFSKG
ncbi:MAG TPA: 2Fe-2S iron-sulfur cluster-binding protein [Polyangia bacterium]|nr:2Fe-2S iron-sulfur cluster-binding protein [Polyangia bacterium]